MIRPRASRRAPAIACALLSGVAAGCGADTSATPGDAGPGGAEEHAAQLATTPIVRPSAFDAPGVAAHAEDALPPPPIEAPAAPRASAAADPTRRHRIQLGAYVRGSAAASVAWEAAVARHASLIGRTPLIGAALLPDGTSIHRLQVAGLTEAEARDLCATLAATGDACLVVPPPHARPR